MVNRTLQITSCCLNIQIHLTNLFSFILLPHCVSGWMIEIMVTSSNATGYSRAVSILNLSHDQLLTKYPLFIDYHIN